MKRLVLAAVTLFSLTVGIGTSPAQGFGFGGGQYGYGQGWGGQPWGVGGQHNYHQGGFQHQGFHRNHFPMHNDHHRTNFWGW